MRHDIHLNGHAFCLRPVELSDAQLIVDLRRDPTRTRFLHRVPLEVSAQETYIERYFERSGDYYFAVARLGAGTVDAEGLVGIYDVDLANRRAEWGRWVVDPRSLAATESAWLIYRVGFEKLGLDEIYCRTLAENTSVLAFHDRAGLTRAGRLESFDEIDGQRCDVIEHVLTRAQWPDTSALLGRQAERLALRMGVAG